LVKCGVPYAEAFKLSRPRRLAYISIFGQLEGRGVFNWTTRRFEDPN